MGREVKCVAMVGGRESEGVAKLETDAMYFKGEVRLKIPFAGIQAVEARDGWLRVSSASIEDARFQLGPAAEKWASTILHPKSRIDKLGVKHGAEVMLLGLDNPGFLAELKPLASRLVQGSRAKNVDVIFCRVHRIADLEKLAGLRLRIKPAGAIWILAPKGKQHIREADVLEAGRRHGFVDTKVVSFSETLTAHKFVIPVAARAHITG